MIFTATSQIIDHVSISATTSFMLLEPDLRRAEINFLKPYLGAAYYATFTSRVDGTNLDTEEEQLLEHARDVVALFAIHNALPKLQLQISDIGVTLHSSDSHKTGWQWQIEDLGEKYLLANGYLAIDNMLRYLDANTGYFTDWAAGDGFTSNKGFIINDFKDFQANFSIQNSPLTYKAMEPMMNKAELFEITSHLGVDYLAEIKAEIAAATISADTTAILTYLKPAVAHYTASRAMRDLPITIRPDGIIVNQIKAEDVNNRERVDAFSMLTKPIENSKLDGDAFMRMLLDYLEENATPSKYATYYTFAGLGDDPVEDDPTLEDDGSTYRKMFTPGL